MPSDEETKVFRAYRGDVSHLHDLERFYIKVGRKIFDHNWQIEETWYKFADICDSW